MPPIPMDCSRAFCVVMAPPVPWMVVCRCRSACRCRAVIARGVTSEISAPVSISSVTGLPSIMAGTLMNPRSKATGISAAFWIAQASGGAGGGGAERSLPVGKLPDGGDGTEDSHDVDEDRADDPLRGARSQTGDLTAQIAADLRDVAFEFRAQRRDVALHPGDVAPGRDFSGKCLGEGGGSTVGLIMREAGAFEAAGLARSRGPPPSQRRIGSRRSSSSWMRATCAKNVISGLSHPTVTVMPVSRDGMSRRLLMANSLAKRRASVRRTGRRDPAAHAAALPARRHVGGLYLLS